MDNGEMHIDLATCLKVFIYVVLFNIVFLSAAIVMHEVGHFLVGTTIEGCSGSIILYDEAVLGPYTSLSCPDPPNELLLYGSSFLLLLPFAFSFLLLKGFAERWFFLVILGLSIFLGAIDIHQITMLPLAEYTSIAVGMVVFLAGEYMLMDRTFNRFSERLYFIDLIAKYRRQEA